MYSLTRFDCMYEVCSHLVKQPRTTVTVSYECTGMMYCGVVDKGMYSGKCIRFLGQFL